jgi:hypothetical protein
MDATTLRRRADLLKGCAAMGGFVVTPQQAEKAVLGAEKSMAEGTAFTLQQSLAEIRQRRRSSSAR